MIRKSILVAALLFLAYECFLRMTDIKWDTSQNDKSGNIISVQDFVYDYSRGDMEKDTIIVGTSVSRKLITDSLGKHYINLAFNAWSNFDGLELVKLNHKRPACLLIETNYAKNQILQPEITSSLDPLSYYPGRAFKSIQLRNQPTGLLVGWGKDQMKERIEKLKEKKRENIELYHFSIRMNKEIMMKSIPDSVLQKRFAVLKTLIDGFRSQKVGIVFYEVPVDKELENATSLLEVRNCFHQYFPENEFRYIPMPPDNDYVFSDGVHLSPQSALEYTLYLKGELKKK
jgi:hypothetical protein